MKKETINPLKKAGVMLLIPALGFFFWAFSKPEYHVTTVESAVSRNDTLKIGTDSIAAPLIIVDGKEFSSSINEINPHDIESVDVLKDHYAVERYGEKGKNGVIVITTKKATDPSESE